MYRYKLCFLSIFCCFKSIFGQNFSGSPRVEEAVEISSMPQRNSMDGVGYYSEHGKFGFVFKQNQRQPAQYDLIKFSNGAYILKQKGKFGLADKKATMVVPIEMDSIAEFYKTFIVKRKNLYGVIDANGQKLLSIAYPKILFAHPVLPYAFVQNAKKSVVLLDIKDEKVLYQDIKRTAVFENGIIFKTNDKFGVAFQEGISPVIYDSIFRTPTEFQTLNKSVKNQGVVWQTNSFFQRVPFFTVMQNGKQGLMNAQGELVFQPEYDATAYREGNPFALVKKGTLFGIYFPKSKVSTTVEYAKVNSTAYQYVFATKDNKAGIFNDEGNIVLPFAYDDTSISHRVGIGFEASKNGKRGMVNFNNEEIIPFEFDDIDTFFENELKGFFRVEKERRFGVVSSQGKLIIPTQYDWISSELGVFKVGLNSPRRVGLMDRKGTILVPVENDWIGKSHTHQSKLVTVKVSASAYQFLNSSFSPILSTHADSYSYVLNAEKLLNPMSPNDLFLISVKDKNGKFGLINELTERLVVPFEYDEIKQYFSSSKHNLYSVRKGNKWGLINDKNQIVIPLTYEAIDVDLQGIHFKNDSDQAYFIVAQKGKYFGVLNLKNEVVVPFTYTYLKRISDEGIFKAKTKTHYSIINHKNELIHPGPFDEVANFEFIDYKSGQDKMHYEALTFFEGKMRVVDQNGTFLTQAVPMMPHQGFSTFDALKFGLVAALDSPNPQDLHDFVSKIAPSEHLLYFLKDNIFENGVAFYPHIPSIQQRYFDELMHFKKQRWTSTVSGYDRSSLTVITDYTLKRPGVVTNDRVEDHAYGTRLMELFLRNAVKINGFWISSYFMKRQF